jgi:hypothetical protein
MNRRLIVVSGLTLLASSFQIGVISAHAQTSSDRRSMTAAGIPSQLQSSLEDGLRRFTEAQAKRQWDEVARLLGRFCGGAQGLLYTPAHKECLLSQMRAMPMHSFVIQQIMITTKILSTPAGKRWWLLIGVAEFKTSSGVTKRQTQITAFRDRGKWYFTPQNYDEAWVRDRITEADFSVDRSANIEIDLDPACPVEIRELSVVIDREFHSLRRLNFTLDNKINKKIIGYGLRLGSIGAHCFGYMQGNPLIIEPHGTSRATEVKYSAYVYYCEGEAKRRIVIDDVSFADGSNWKDPRFRKNRIPKDCSF